MKSSLNKAVDVISGLVQKHIVINNKIKQNLLNQQNYYELENKLDNLQKLIGSNNSSSSSISMDIYKCAKVFEEQPAIMDVSTITATGVPDPWDISYNIVDSSATGTSRVWRGTAGYIIYAQVWLAPPPQEPLNCWVFSPDSAGMTYVMYKNSTDPFDNSVPWVDTTTSGTQLPEAALIPLSSSPAVEASWSGYKYNFETKEFSNELTKGLKYKIAAPIVGKVYNTDATMLIDLYTPEGMVFYAPLHEAKAMDEFGRILNIPSGVEFTILNNVKMAKFDNECITFDCSDFPTDGSRTISCFAKCNSVTYGYEVAAFGYGTGSQTRVFFIGALRESSGRFYFGSTYGGDISSEIAGTLVHLALSYCKETKILNFYINGILIGTQENLSLNTALQNGKIGSAMWNSMGWGGYISECKLWNRVLSAEEIKAEADRCLAMVTE